MSHSLRTCLFASLLCSVGWIAPFYASADAVISMHVTGDPCAAGTFGVQIWVSDNTTGTVGTYAFSLTLPAGIAYGSAADGSFGVSPSASLIEGVVAFSAFNAGSSFQNGHIATLNLTSNGSPAGNLALGPYGPTPLMTTIFNTIPHAYDQAGGVLACNGDTPTNTPSATPTSTGVPTHTPSSTPTATSGGGAVVSLTLGGNPCAAGQFDVNVSLSGNTAGNVGTYAFGFDLPPGTSLVSVSYGPLGFGSSNLIGGRLAVSAFNASSTFANGLLFTVTLSTTAGAGADIVVSDEGPTPLSTTTFDPIAHTMDNSGGVIDCQAMPTATPTNTATNTPTVTQIDTTAIVSVALAGDPCAPGQFGVQVSLSNNNAGAVGTYAFGFDLPPGTSMVSVTYGPLGAGSWNQIGDRIAVSAFNASSTFDNGLLFTATLATTLGAGADIAISDEGPTPLSTTGFVPIPHTFDNRGGVIDCPVPPTDTPTETFIPSPTATPVQTGSFTALIDPAEVRSLAKWRLTTGPDTYWKLHGRVISGIPVGTYTVTFYPISGWTKPPDQQVVIGEGANELSVSYYSTTRTGSLTVTLYPGFLTASKKWRVLAGPDQKWKLSGATLSNLPVGSYPIVFGAIAGWEAPAATTVPVLDGANAAAFSYYALEDRGNLTVLLHPDLLGSAGKWRLTEGPNTTWKVDGATIYNLRAGAYPIAFRDAPGWTKPGDQWVDVAPGANTPWYSYYSQTVFGNLTVAVQPPEVPAKWRLLNGPDQRWKLSGATIYSLPYGIYTATFRDIAGWIKPADQAVAIEKPSTLLNAEYVEDPASQTAETVEPVPTPEPVLPEPTPTPTEFLMCARPPQLAGS